MRRARSPSRACTAPTASPPTACSNASCSARRRRSTSPRNWDALPDVAGDPRLGREPGDRQRRGSRHHPDLGRDPPLHVELCRHRPHHQAARAREAPDRHAPAGSRRLLRAFPGDAGPDRAAQPGRGRRPHHPLGASRARKPRAALHARLSRHAASRRRTRCWFPKRRAATAGGREVAPLPPSLSVFAAAPGS